MRAGPSLPAASARGEVVEADRAGGQRAPVQRSLGQQRQRAVDLLARVVEGAAQVELVVVQRAGRQHGVGPALAAADEHDAAARAHACTASRQASGRPTASNTTSWSASRSALIAPAASAWARRSAWRSASVTVRPSATSSAASIWPIGPPPSTPTSGAQLAPARRSIACTAAASGSAIAAAAGLEPVGHAVQRRLRRRHQLGEAAEHPAAARAQICGRPAAQWRHAPHATESPTSTRSPVSSRTPPSRGRSARGTARAAGGRAPRLDVGPAGRGGLDPDEHLAGPRHRVGDLDHAQVLVPEQQRRPHGTTTALAPRPSRCAARARRRSRRARTGREERGRTAPRRACSSASAARMSAGPGRPARGHAQLAREHGPAVDAERRARLRRRVQAQRPARRERLRGVGDRRRVLGADDRHVDLLVAVRGRAASLGRAPAARGRARAPTRRRRRARARPPTCSSPLQPAPTTSRLSPGRSPARSCARSAQPSGSVSVAATGSSAVERQQLVDQLRLRSGRTRRSRRGRARSRGTARTASRGRAGSGGTRRTARGGGSRRGRRPRTPRTSAPTSTTSPTGSWPSTAGSLRSTYQPTSEPQVAHASTRQTTSPGPQTGSGRSSIRVSPRATVSATLTPPSPPCRPSPAGRRRAR